MNYWPLARIWGDGTNRYSRQNIRVWLLYHPQIFDSTEATTSLRWAEIKADLDIAVGRLPPYLQEFFRMYCVEQLELHDILAKRGWRAQTCDDYWCRLINGVCAGMCDSEMREMDEETLNHLPTFRTDHYREDGNTPVGNFHA